MEELILTQLEELRNRADKTDQWKSVVADELVQWKSMLIDELAHQLAPVVVDKERTDQSLAHLQQMVNIQRQTINNLTMVIDDQRRMIDTLTQTDKRIIEYINVMRNQLGDITNRVQSIEFKSGPFC